MKKVFAMLMLFTVMILNGCDTDATENEVELNPQEEQYTLEDVDLEVGLDSEEDDPQEEQYDSDDEDESQVDYSPLVGLRGFPVATGDHGYLGVQWIEHMNDYLPNRLAFSDRELETAEWIEKTLLEIGFAESQIEMQTFGIDTTTSSWWGSASRLIEWFETSGYYNGLERLNDSQNVILTIPGRSEETIVIGAHYDGVNNPGISDNAGGTVLLLESAYRMRNIDHYYTLQYVFFGAEEVGLIGAFYFVDNMTEEEIDNLIMMINADVIMDGPDLIYAIGSIDNLPQYPMDILWGGLTEISQSSLSEQIKGIADRLNVEHGTELMSKPHAITLASDQLAFVQFDFPVMVFYGTHPVTYPEVFDGDVLHTEFDCLDFIVENHPGRVERALYEFGLFLEEVLSSEFVQ